jgi:hypothetical protein
MSLMDKIFGNVRAATAPTQLQQSQPQQQQQPTNNPNQNQSIQTQQSPNTAPNGVIPQDGNKPPEGTAEKKEDQSPVAKFNDLWEPPKTEDGTPPSTGFDSQKWMEAAGKIDFTKVVSQEDLSKISAGGQDAVAAFANALNKTAQTVFGQATIVSQKMIDKRIEEAREEFSSQIPSLVRKQSMQDGLLGKNPAFANPAIRPLIEAVQAQIAERYPKATSGELEQMAQDYLAGAAQIISPPKQKQAQSDSKNRGAKDDEDWEAYLQS